MPTPSKVYRRRLRRLKSPSRSSKSKSRERRQRSVSPSRSRWRDDIRKMKSWRESKKGISMEKKCHKSLGSSLGKTKRVQLKKKIRKRTNSKTDEFILPNIHGSEIKTQTIEEERILKLIPPEEPYQPANIEETLVACSRELLTRKISSLGIQMETYITRLRELEKERRRLIQQRECLMVK